MTTKYLLTNGKKYICSNESNEIYTNKCPYEAFVTTDISRLLLIYDAIPDKYALDNWYVIDYSSAMDKQTRYIQAQKNRNKENKKTSTKYKRTRINRDTKKILYKKYNGKCAICGKHLTLDPSDHANYISIDHIVPLDKGGTNKFTNYQATCCACNLAKTNIMPEVFKNSMKSVLFESIISEKECQEIFLKAIIKIKFTHFTMAVKSFML